MLHANRIQKLAVTVTHAYRSDRRPQFAAIATLETFLDCVAIDVTLHLALKLCLVGLRAFGQGLIEYRAANEFFR